MRCGTYPAQAAQAGIRLPLTLEADNSGYDPHLAQSGINYFIFDVCSHLVVTLSIVY